MQLDVFLLDKAAAAVGTQRATAAYFGAWAGYSLITGASSAIIGSVTYAQAAVYGPSYCQVGGMQTCHHSKVKRLCSMLPLADGFACAQADVQMRSCRQVFGVPCSTGGCVRAQLLPGGWNINLLPQQAEKIVPYAAVTQGFACARAAVYGPSYCQVGV
jgi:hypothetical protein